MGENYPCYYNYLGRLEHQLDIYEFITGMRVLKDYDFDFDDSTTYNYFCLGENSLTVMQPYEPYIIKDKELLKLSKSKI